MIVAAETIVEVRDWGIREEQERMSWVGDSDGMMMVCTGEFWLWFSLT